MTHEWSDGLTRDLVYVAGSSVLSAEVAGEAVLLEMTSGTYFSLNPTGALIWRSIDPSVSLGEIERRVALEFDRAGDEVWPDLQAFIGTLESRGLVRRTNGDGSGSDGG